MNIYKPNQSDKSFEYFSSHFGFSVAVIIYPPTDEGIANGLHFLDQNQLFPLRKFLEQIAIKLAQGDSNKAQALLRMALDWDSGRSQSREEKDTGVMVLDAAFQERRKAYEEWRRRNLLPLVKKDEIEVEVSDAIGIALSNFERIKLEELAEKVGYSINTSLKTPEGTYSTKKVRGRRVSIFKANLGRIKGSKNSKPKVTYERIVREIKRFKDNAYGIVPSEKHIASRLGCTQKTIKNCLLVNGEQRRFTDFARAVLGEK